MRLIDKAKNYVRRNAWEFAEDLEQYTEKDQNKIKRAWGIGFIMGYLQAGLYWRWCLIFTFFDADMAYDKFEDWVRKINRRD
jgi:hypothetical protein